MFIAREFDRQRFRVHTKKEITCIKKPLQEYQLNKYLRRIKNIDFDLILKNTSTKHNLRNMLSKD